MRSFTLSCLVLLSICTTNSYADLKEDWVKAGFTNVEVRELEFGSGNSLRFRYKLQISLIMFRNTNWTEENILGQMKKVSKIYEQCLINIQVATLFIVDPPEGKTEIHPNDQSRMITFAKQIPSIPRPIVMFTGPNPYVGMNSAMSIQAWSNPKFTIDANPFERDILDTAMISDMQLNPNFDYAKDTGYNVVAHELAHIIGNTGHVTDSSRNLLGKYPADRSGRLTTKQCQSFWTYPGLIGYEAR